MSATVGHRGVQFARITLILLELFAGLGALYGGVGLAAGNAIRMPDEWLTPTPFGSWTWPGILLIAIVAVPMLVAAAAELRRTSWATLASLGAGALQIGWILAQWAIIGRYDPLQPTMLAVGVAVTLFALARFRSAR